MGRVGASRAAAAWLLVLWAAAGAVRGAPEVPAWRIDAAASAIRFEVKLFGGRVRGVFTRFDADIRFDPEHLDESRIEASVDMASVNTRNSERDAEILEPGWLDASTYRRATFRSEVVRSEGEGYVVEGVLALRGKEVRISIPLALTVDGSNRRLAGETTVDRTAFGIGAGAWGDEKVLGKTVHVSVDIRASVP